MGRAGRRNAPVLNRKTPARHPLPLISVVEAVFYPTSRRAGVVKVALVLNGDEPSSKDLTLLDSCDAVVCADGAARFLLKTERPPTMIVGDLDSLDPDAYKWADALDIPIIRYPEDKDFTDGELALQKAMELEPKSILILGGHGKRTGMFLGNIKLLRACHDQGLEAAMVGHGESIRFVSSGAEKILTGRTGSILNLLAVDEDAKVTVTGTDYDVQETTLRHTSCRGLSNPITEDAASIKVHEGTAILVVERPPVED